MAELQQRFEKCCDGNVEFVEPMQPEFDDLGISFKVKCSKCGAEYDEYYVQNSIRHPKTDEVLKWF